MISDRVRPYRRFLLVAAATAGLLGLPLISNLMLFARTGETAGFAEVAVEQQASGALYGSALHGNRWAHRLELLRARKAEVVVLGSSRAEQFRDVLFESPFVCLCTVMGSIGQAIPLIREMLAVHRPSHLVLVVDHWWFADIPLDPDDFWTQAGDTRITDRKLLRPFDWLFSGSLTPEDYVRMVAGASDLKRLSAEKKIGIQAVAIGRGYRPDGSALHADRVFGGVRPETETDFASVTARLRAGNSVYPHDRKVSSTRLEEIARIATFARKNGMSLTLMLAPMAPTVSDAMRSSGHFRYVEDIRLQLRASAETLKLEYFDFYDARSVGADDCEFVDDRHGGEVVSARMIAAAAVRGGSLSRYVSREHLTRLVAESRGHSLLWASTDRYLQAEADFLGLGCRKERRPAPNGVTPGNRES